MILTIDAESRVTMRKSDLTELRSKGMIPAVVYGEKMESKSIAVKKVEFMKAYKKSFHEVTFYNVQLDGKKYFSILKEKQVHPVTRDLLHLDFLTISKKHSFEFDVPFSFEGEPIGLKKGGMMDIIQRSVKIKCLPDQVPEAIQLDVSNMEVGTTIHVSDLPTGSWEYTDNADNTIIVVHAKKGEAEASSAEQESEPETNAE